MSGKVTPIDSVEHAALVLKSLRKTSSQARYGAGGAVSLSMFDDVVAKAGLALSEKQKMDQRMESLIAQDPVPQSPARIMQKSKDLDTALELSPGKERALFKSTGPGPAPPRVFSASNAADRRGKKKQSSSNNNNREDVDFSSDEDDQDERGSHGPPYPAVPERLERVALNRPSRKTTKGQRTNEYDNDNDDEDAAAMRALSLEGGLGGGSPNSFYDAEATLDSDDDDDDEDNAALFKGFIAPTIAADSVFATAAQSIAHSKAAHSPLRQSHAGGSSASVSASVAGSVSGVRVAKPPAVPATQTTKDLSSRGVVVGKGGIFIRAGGRSKSKRAGEA